VHDKGIADEDWVQIVRDQPGFSKATPGELNRAIYMTVYFLNDKCENPMSGRTIFHNKRRVVTNAKDKTKRKISFYYVLSDHRKESLNQKQSSGRSFGMTRNETIERSNDPLINSSEKSPNPKREKELSTSLSGLNLCRAKPRSHIVRLSVDNDMHCGSALKVDE
jgi:hypothetical protein